jgi:hypothetical protein
VVNLAILSKTSSHIEKFLETQSQEKFLETQSQEKEAILLFHIQENTWKIIVKNSQIYLSKVN